ncbi:MAG: tetratricopeptide repeat protein [Zoogloeaceae bacterium]|jgi:MSHA biogenesis protein MshN|nr:tetratricopeptide repeat protein [Zoogloeaceae bacterium]
MSLINSMLQDLDKRAPPAADDSLPPSIPPTLLTAAPPRRRRTGWIACLILALLVAGGAWYWQMQQTQQKPTPMPEPLASAAPAIPAPDPAPAPMPVVEPAPAPEASPVAETAAPSAAEITPPSPSAAHEPEAPPTPPIKTPSRPPEAPLPHPPKSHAASSAPARIEISRADPAPPAPATAQATPVAHDERAQSLYLQGVEALDAGRAPEAIELLRAALMRDPAHADARRLLVRTLIGTRQFGEAVPLLEDSLTRFDTLSDRMLLARIRLEDGQPNMAWQALEPGLPRAEANAEYQAFAGAVLRQLQRSGEAIDHYRAATRLAPGEGRYWIGLGLAQEESGDLLSAQTAYRTALERANLPADLRRFVATRLGQ